jgi:3-oxoadipate enol-lactonase
MSVDVEAPPLPPGRDIALPGRGTTFVRELPGPSPGAPVVMLMHGWTATADLNFFALYERLGRHFRVVALDHRGHGRGVRTRRMFRLADCADDAACLAHQLGIERFVPVGYSMGGPVALLTWRRHAPAVAGLVLCATAAQFAHSRTERMSFLGLGSLGAMARFTPPPTRGWVTDQVFLKRRAERWGPWALQEATRHDWRMVLEAGGALGSFSAHDWLGDIDVPTSVVVTTRDQVVPVRRQMQLAHAIPTAQVHHVDGEHDAAVAQAHTFADTLITAVRRVVAT